jgi:hypothetical protein
VHASRLFAVGPVDFIAVRFPCDTKEAVESCIGTFMELDVIVEAKDFVI